MRGAVKEGTMRARKIRPAPVEVQVKVRLTNRGRTESKEVVRAAWTRQPQSAARRRRDFRSVMTGGRLWMKRVDWRVSDAGLAEVLAAAVVLFSCCSRPEIWCWGAVSQEGLASPLSSSCGVVHCFAIFFSTSANLNRISKPISANAIANTA